MDADAIINELDPSKKKCSCECGEYIPINMYMCDECCMKFQYYCELHIGNHCDKYFNCSTCELEWTRIEKERNIACLPLKSTPMKLLIF